MTCNCFAPSRPNVVGVAYYHRIDETFVEEVAFDMTLKNALVNFNSEFVQPDEVTLRVERQGS